MIYPFKIEDNCYELIKKGEINMEDNVIPNAYEDFFYDYMTAYNHFKKESEKCGVELSFHDFIQTINAVNIDYIARAFDPDDITMMGIREIFDDILHNICGINKRL